MLSLFLILSHLLYLVNKLLYPNNMDNPQLDNMDEDNNKKNQYKDYQYDHKYHMGAYIYRTT